MLEQAAAERPLLVVLEDVHWSDEGTRHLLRFALHALQSAPVLLLASYRNDELHRRHPLRPYLGELVRLPMVSRVELPRLDQAQVTAMVASRLDRPPSPELVRQVHERSEGIPYFVAELAQAVTGDCLNLPDTLRDALLVRAGRMSEDAQALVRLMSTAGTSISHALLREVGDGSEAGTDDLLREAVDAGVLVPTEDGYAFRHALLREVLHEELLPGEHARAHVRFAEALTAHPELQCAEAATELAHHWYAGHQLDRAFTAALTAAESTASPYERLKMYDRVLELWERVDPERHGGRSRADVLEAAAFAARRTGDSRRGLPLIAAALAETDIEDEPLVAARRMVTKALLEGLSVDDLTKSYTDAISTATRAVELTDGHGDTEERARALDALSTQLMLTGNLAEALQTAREAESVAVAVGLDHLRSSAMNTQGCVLVSRGEEEAGLELLRRSAPLAAGNPWLELRYSINMSDALLSADRAAESAELAVAGIERARQEGIARSTGAMLIGNAMEALLEVGEWTRAAQLRRTGEELLPIGHHALHLTLVSAWMDVWQGRGEAARDALELTGSSTPAGRLPQYTRLWWTARSDRAWCDGDPALAWRELQPLLERHAMLKVQDCWQLLAQAARSASGAPDPAAAARLLRERAAALPTDVAVARWAGPLLEAELTDTVPAWEPAVEALERGPAWLRPYARWRLAQHQLAAGQRHAAAASLDAGVATASALALAPLLDRQRELRRRTGTDGAGGVGPLTPRESEVLRLVAEGRSNAEIGADLFISVKTASVHVSNILAKLKASSRGEAAAKARRQGLLG
ncbi:hypothetical protein DT076_14395 [Desertihabitans brevis]|uniref:HTH luxR-type domain-containing protein n=1 Tax=Desertihabitans brevis TaxID=2268447 RepID=A0A367YSH6_9ACTN|nr:hypothetical protein DT076_14395 [Desertihabitans brevis]